MCDAYRASFQAMRAAQMHHLEPLYPGAADAVTALARRENVVLGIATGKSQRGVRNVLARHGLLEHFITIKTADDAPSKPDPGMVLAAMREAGVEARDTVVVGDTVYDIAMARAAGAAGDRRDVGLSSGRGARPGRRIRADRGVRRARTDARQILDTVTHKKCPSVATVPQCAVHALTICITRLARRKLRQERQHPR